MPSTKSLSDQMHFGVYAGIFVLCWAQIVAKAQSPASPAANPQKNGRSDLSKAPYPPSKVIRDLTWEWETYTNAAPGSDLWPVTWGPDDNLYVAWGDGGGFGGTDSDGRVAMGFGRIEGGPENWRGFNVNGGKNPEHPATFLKKGKTGGILFLDGMLYASVNLQDQPWPDVNHVLAWSADNGATWTQADWTFPRGVGNFQPAKFLNFGKDYTGVPEFLGGYVYLYGQRQPASGRNGNEIYLARVPVEKIREKAAYEFFRGPDGSDKPLWGKERDAKSVFSDANGVAIGSVSYDPGMKRFLLTSFHTGPSQLGVFDGPTPWGPWASVAYYEAWGEMVREGEGLNCEFPQKWMSADGLTLWSIFAVYGDGAKKGIKAHDRFNLIRVKLTLADKAR